MAKAPARNAVEEAADEVEKTNLPATNPLMANLPVLDESELGLEITGWEHLKQNDFIIPRLAILESLSPQLLKSKPEYIEGAQRGDFVDTSLGEYWRGALHLIPCTAMRMYLEWPSKRGGGGSMRNHGTDPSILDQTTERLDERGVPRRFLPNGNIVSETLTFYVLNVSAGGRPSFIPMSGTRFKWGARWNSQISALKGLNNGRIVTPAYYTFSWFATPKTVSNDQGEWFVWSFTPGPKTKDIDEGLFQLAADFAKQVQSGLLKPDLDMEESGPARSREAEDAPM